MVFVTDGARTYADVSRRAEDVLDHEEEIVSSVPRRVLQAHVPPRRLLRQRARRCWTPAHPAIGEGAGGRPPRQRARVGLVPAWCDGGDTAFFYVHGSGGEGTPVHQSGRSSPMTVNYRGGRFFFLELRTLETTVVDAGTLRTAPGSWHRRACARSTMGLRLLADGEMEGVPPDRRATASGRWTALPPDSKRRPSTTPADPLRVRHRPNPTTTASGFSVS